MKPPTFNLIGSERPCHFIGSPDSALLSTETSNTHSEQQHMLVFHVLCLIFLTHAISVKRWWHLTETEQMRRPKHHLGTMHISNRQQPLITCCSLDWPSTAPQPPAPDFFFGEPDMQQQSVTCYSVH